MKDKKKKELIETIKKIEEQLAGLKRDLVGVQTADSQPDPPHTGGDDDNTTP